MSLSRFAICLYEEGSTFDSIELVTGETLSKVPLLDHVNINAVVYQRKADLILPTWTEVVRQFSDITLSKLKTASSGAILLIQIKNRVFGCCFGSSAANINRSLIETDFGLGVAFTKMQSNKTKSVESFTLGHNPITSNKSAAIPSVRFDFNLDRMLENITQLTGYQYVKNRRTLIKGKEFFSSPIPQNLDEIVELCESCYDAYLAAKGRKKNRFRIFDFGKFSK